MRRTILQAKRAPISFVTAVCCVLAALFCALPAGAVRAQDGAVQTIVAAINQARANNGLPALPVNALLNQAAQAHADDVINNYNYSHWGTDGSTVYQRVARTGYSTSPWVSENWVSASSPEGAMAWWMSDYIHRVNILNGNWVELGVGVAVRSGEMIFVTVFSGGYGSGEPVVTAAAAGAVAAPVVAQPASVPYEGMDYTVLPGDTLSTIAQRYATDWTIVAQANGLTDTTLLQIGQVIHLPGAGESPGARFGTGGASMAAQAVPSEPYIVRSGDTLFSIAAGKGMTWEDLATFNGVSEAAVLQIGEVIRIPLPESADAEASAGAAAQVELEARVTRETLAAATAQVQPEAASELSMLEITSDTPTAFQPVYDPGVPVGEYYQVQAGDTIFIIAIQNDLDWQNLLALNDLTESSLLQLGQRIRIR